MQINQNSRIGKTIKSLAARLAGAIFVVLVLLTFMILMRLLDAKRLPEKTIRTMETIDELACHHHHQLKFNLQRRRHLHRLSAKT